ncbi:MAG TPA: ADP-ribosylglycohydrolase family protein [Brumimicrobium sp.]|nr:ADP-ribosylglycohydrolase family protein [Brumimicrobium sp.]
MKKDITKSILFGVAIGDALGVPVEFLTREEVAKDPVTDLRGMGTYKLPAGTWSDDSSLTFCLAEVIADEFNLNTIAENFVKWQKEGYWSATKKIFDIGVATMEALSRLENGVEAVKAGGTDERDNGNGSLMRILPLLVYIKNKPIQERFKITQQVSSITHGHIRSTIACFYYLEFAKKIVEGKDKMEAYQALKKEIPAFLNSIAIDGSEIELFSRILNGDIQNEPEEKIDSGGYVLSTLEASLWCLLSTNSYKEAVLKAVNLADDSDTTGAVTGGLAGLIYGFDSIPKEWVDGIVKTEKISRLAEDLEKVI